MLFLMILGYSRMRYIEFVTDMSTNTLIRCYQNAFRYFGGYTEEILYDNRWNVFFEIHAVLFDFSSAIYIFYNKKNIQGNLLLKPLWFCSQVRTPRNFALRIAIVFLSNNPIYISHLFYRSSVLITPGVLFILIPFAPLKAPFRLGKLRLH